MFCEPFYPRGRQLLFPEVSYCVLKGTRVEMLFLYHIFGFGSERLLARRTIRKSQVNEEA